MSSYLLVQTDDLREIIQETVEKAVLTALKERDKKII
jgi:predicted RecB family endonuclease